MEQIPVILDTDIGSDIDDAVALAYLLKQPRCNLIGVTTVSGEPDKRASLVDAICQAAGRPNVPIHVGTDLPILALPRQERAPQAEALTDAWPHRAFDRRNTAVHFLQKTIRSRPGEITLLTIGPLTNIGLLFAIDPEIPGLLKQLVMMGGRFYPEERAGAEWNIQCDPHAAARVFAAPISRLIAVGLDVTCQCVLDAEECRRRFTAAGGPLAPTAAMAEVWFRHSRQITFHDPLAAALVFEEGICSCEAAQVEVVLEPGPDCGRTRLVQNAGAPERHIAAAVDSAAFFEHYFSVVGG